MFEKKMLQQITQKQENEDSIEQNQQLKQKQNIIIPQIILNKHLTEQYPFQDFFNDLIEKYKKYWALTSTQFMKNIRSMIFMNWSFNQQLQQQQSDPDQLYNQSLYLVIWGPINIIFYTHLFHNQPFQSRKYETILGGILDVCLMILLSFGIYVYCKVTGHSIYNYLQHLCVSSYIGLITIIYSLICIAAIDIVLIPMSIIYVIISSFLHFSIYNSTLRPQLLECVVLGLIIMGFYCIAGIMFYHLFSVKTVTVVLISSQNSNLDESINKTKHFLMLHHQN